MHLVDAGLLLHLLGHVGQQPMARLELAACRPVEDSGLDQGQTAADDIGAELRDGEPHGAGTRRSVASAAVTNACATSKSSRCRRRRMPWGGDDAVIVR